MQFITPGCVFYFIFKTLILLLAGPDPLDPWYRYICWVEQSYPKGGKEGNVHVLLEKCIKTFKVRYLRCPCSVFFTKSCYVLRTKRLTVLFVNK
jgi:hypothetical protein